MGKSITNGTFPSFFVLVYQWGGCSSHGALTLSKECTSPTSRIPWTRLAPGPPCRWACPLGCWSDQPLEAMLLVIASHGQDVRNKKMEGVRNLEEIGILFMIKWTWFWHVFHLMLMWLDGGSRSQWLSHWKTQTKSPFCNFWAKKHGSGIATNIVDDQSILIILYMFSPYYLVGGLEHFFP